MRDVKKGELRNPEQQQPTNYSGMVYNVLNQNGTIVEITPTDIDGLLEMEGRLAIFKEFKYNDSPLEVAQSISFKNICDGLVEGTYLEAVALHIGHYDGEAEQIDCAKGIVLNTYIGGLNKWSNKYNGLTADEAVQRILRESNYNTLTDKEVIELKIERQKARLIELKKMLDNV